MSERLGDSALWSEVRDVAYRTLRARGWSHDKADDAAQDTVLDLQAELEKGTVLRNPAGWAAMVANRRAVDRHRRARLPDQSQIDLNDSVGRFLADGQPTSLQAMQREQVARFVEALDERDLQMAWLTAEGLSQAEIGEVLGISADGVKKALQRMRKRLRDRAGELGIDVDVLDHPRVY
jgi:RNA polymerase sigma factor (sigma-70 family)